MAGVHGFTAWVRWADRRSLPDLGFPGVYVLALSEDDLTGEDFSWLKCIAYVGMTNSKGGLRQRLRQFDRTIHGGEGHGGAQRFMPRHPEAGGLEGRLFVAVRPFPCDVSSNRAEDLRTMGSVAAFEYECFADYVELHGELPEFNDKERSPKS